MLSDTDRCNALLSLKLPPQELAQLSFCADNTPSALQDWLDQLPHTEARIISTHFYRALPEIARLQTPVLNRIALLDKLWEPLHYCLTGLAKDFLNQPVILPEAARKAATLAQALQKHMTQGWLVVLRELYSNPPLADPQQHTPLIALAIHRALSSHAAFMLRSWQLYIPASAPLWQEVHLLYRLAESTGVARRMALRLDNNEPLSGTIEQIYVRILLLASARPNQLRQDELGQLWRALIALGSSIYLQSSNDADPLSLFVVDITGDQPPVYQTQMTEQQHPHWRQPAMGEIHRFITDMLPSSTAEASLAHNPLRAMRPPLSVALLRHLQQAWYRLAKRHDDRQLSQGYLEVTIGLSNLHYHLSNRTPFDVFLEQVDMVRNKQATQHNFQHHGIQLKMASDTVDNDPWSDAFHMAPASSSPSPSTRHIDAAIRQHQRGEYQGHHPTHRVPLVDSSEKGYCLEWQGDIPAQVKAGELLGLKADGEPHWRIGVIRWVQQTLGATQLGIQVLAAQARPVALATIHKTGDFTEYLRGLQLPAQRRLKQPSTLITNAVSFRESYKVRLFVPAATDNGSGEEKPGIAQSLQLEERLFSTGAFSQFTFRPITTLGTEQTVAPPKK